MTTQRTRIYFHGYELITGKISDSYDGRAYHWFAKRIETRGHPSEESAQAALKQQVLEDVAKNQSTYIQKISEKHEERMRNGNKPYSGWTVSDFFARENHCFECKRPVSNLYDIVCRSCKWIVCNNCAACGCFYKGL